MNPDTNRFEALKELFGTSSDSPTQKSRFVDEIAKVSAIKAATRLLRPDGSEVPKHWAVFQIGELVVIKDYTFKVAYINDGAILFEPVGPKVIEEFSDDELLKRL